jgi:peroxiredoxin
VAVGGAEEGNARKKEAMMAVTSSTMLELGTRAPAFALRDTDGKLWSLDEFPQPNPVLVMFICNHCPFVKHVQHELAKFAREYQARGVGIVAINSNDATRYPDDSPEKMKAERARVGYSFPYLIDETQEVAKAYGAACTPDFYLFDGERRLVYRGQLDESRPGNEKPINGADLRRALDSVLAGEKPTADQKPSVGCNIKWRPGNEPAYFSMPAAPPA